MKVSSFSALTTILVFTFVWWAPAWADLGPSNVLVLVNQNSNSSCYVAKLYQKYYPALPADQILYLSNLTDSCGPTSTAADEIITRADYEASIAEPVRQYLSDPSYPDRLEQIRVIITTAGMPYRIADPVYTNAVTAAASNPYTILNNTRSITAASVESELSCLWYVDYGSNPFGQGNRIVNPYQGYRQSPVDLFERRNPIPDEAMSWLWAYSADYDDPIMEGQFVPPFPPPEGTSNRRFNAGDIYLTCRLDGPKVVGQSGVFAVRAMLERAKRASNAALWGGVNPQQAVVVFDDAPNQDNIDQNRVYNLDDSVNYWVFDPEVSQPPDAPTQNMRDDYVAGFVNMTGAVVNNDVLNQGEMALAGNLLVLLDKRSHTRTTQADLETGQLLILLASYGTNGDEGSGASYLLTGGPSGGPLFDPANGAVFTSIESFNNLTMFSNVATSPVAQGKIVDFISIGGAGAVGHVFEPLTDSIVDNEFLFYNLLADSDGDNKADLTFVEAAFTAIQYLSWSETVIGDPLMRFEYGSGGAAWSHVPGDANNDGVVNNRDIKPFLDAYYGYGALNSTDPNVYGAYNDLCDFNQDGVINGKDVRIFLDNLYGM